MTSSSTFRVIDGAKRAAVSNLAALRAFSSWDLSATDWIDVAGGLAPGDRLGGSFVWQPDGTDPDNGQTIIAPLDSPARGRWHLAIGQGNKGETGPAGPQGLQGDQGDGLAAVMAPNGASLVGFKQTNVRDKLSETISPSDYGVQAGSQVVPALASAVTDMFATRVQNPLFAEFGLGRITIPRGLYPTVPATLPQNQYGLTLQGSGRISTSLTTAFTEGNGLSFGPYHSLRVADLSLQNTTAENPGASTPAVGIHLNGLNGGHINTFDRISLVGYRYGIKIEGTTNCDFGTYNQIETGSKIGFSNSSNKNAISHVFNNASIGCATAAFELGGAGDVQMYGGGVNVNHTLVKFNEAAGIGSIYPQVFSAHNVKMEYTAGDCLLIDATETALTPDGGGAEAETLFHDCNFVLGDNAPGNPVTDTSYDDHQIVNIAGGRHRLRMLGGYIRGAINYVSNYFEDKARWSFTNMRAAPLPKNVTFSGSGSHALMEWRGNENVADQYKGGSSGLRSIDRSKALLWRHIQNRVINTGVERTQFTQDGATRYGANFTIDLTAAGLKGPITVEGLALFVETNHYYADTRVDWFTDSTFTTLIEGKTFPYDARGKLLVSAQEQTTAADGKLFVRITKSGDLDDGTIGALVINYFPYFGNA